MKERNWLRRYWRVIARIELRIWEHRHRDCDSRLTYRLWERLMQRWQRRHSRVQAMAQAWMLGQGDRRGVDTRATEHDERQRDADRLAERHWNAVYHRDAPERFVEPLDHGKGE